MSLEILGSQENVCAANADAAVDDGDCVAV